jgi:hypothetical protein
MAYLICPDCMMPNPAADDAVSARCFACFAELVFETCPACSFEQSISTRWQRAFTCGKCGGAVPIPRSRSYSTSTRAARVKGYGYAAPRA